MDKLIIIIKQDWLTFINLSYALIERVIKYFKEFVDHQLVSAKARELRQCVENNVIDYNRINTL